MKPSTKETLGGVLIGAASTFAICFAAVWGQNHPQETLQIGKWTLAAVMGIIACGLAVGGLLWHMMRGDLLDDDEPTFVSRAVVWLKTTALRVSTLARALGLS